MSKVKLEEISNDLELFHGILDKDLKTVIRAKEKNTVINKYFKDTNQADFEKAANNVVGLLSNAYDSIDNTLDTLHENIKKLREVKLNENEIEKVANTLDRISETLNNDFESLMSVRHENAKMKEQIEKNKQTNISELLKDIEDLLHYVNDNIEHGYNTLYKSKKRLTNKKRNFYQDQGIYLSVVKTQLESRYFKPKLIIQFGLILPYFIPIQERSSYYRKVKSKEVCQILFTSFLKEETILQENT